MKYARLFSILILLISVPLLIPGCGSGGGGNGGGGGGGGNGGGEDGGGAAPSAYTVSGTVEAPSNSAVDSDVNNEDAPYASNDSIALAQSIPNPVTLGGYVNVPNSGQPGRSYISGDMNDYFKADLTASQTITLSMGESTADLDLYLLDSGGNIIDSSTGTDQTETLKVSAAGTYYIRVYAYSGHSNYILSIGMQVMAMAEERPLSVTDDFVPGQIIVRFRDDMLTAQGTDSLYARSASTGLTAHAGAPGRSMLLGLGDHKQKMRAFQKLGITHGTSGTDSVISNEMQLKLDTIKAIQALRKRPDVLYAEPNYILQAYAVPNDGYYSYQWHYPLINLPQAWDITTGSSNVTVAVLDTGVLLNHPDLQTQLTAGYDFINDPANSLDGDGIDNNPNDPGNQQNPDGSSSFHGTHVAGTVAAATSNNKGVAGVAWNVKIMPVRVLGKGGRGSSYDILQGVRYASGLQNDSGTVPARRADIINLSLGGSSYSQDAQSVYTQARNAGVIIIAASGNSSTGIPHYPASYNGVVSVSAVDINKALTSYSNYGAAIDVAAPGGDSSRDNNGDGYGDGVLSTDGDDKSGPAVQFTYAFKDGTSMACPHVAGVAALMKSVNAAMTPDNFDTWLQSGDLTDDIGSAGRDDKFGYGLINAKKAVTKAQSSPVPSTPVLVISPQSLNFGTTLNSATISVRNGGGGLLTVNNPTDNASWLNVSPLSVDASNIGTYTVTINRSGLSDGTYSASIEFSSSANTVTVPVIMQTSSSGSSNDAGYHYVLLINPDTFDTVHQFAAAANNGLYAYTFSSVAPGEYLIVAGTDFDNDDYICESGEACGIYRTLDQPQTINTNNNLAGLDFYTGYQLELQSNSNSATRGYKLITQKKTGR